jgi:hypothetical protein
MCHSPGNSKGASLMRSYFKPSRTPPPPPSLSSPTSPHLPPPPVSALGPCNAVESSVRDDQTSVAQPGPTEIFTGYLSDVSDEGGFMPEDEDSDDERGGNVDNNVPADPGETSFPIQAPPPLKRRRLDVPVRVQIQRNRDERQEKLALVLKDIEKLISSKKDIFDAGQTGLQSYRAWAVQSYLNMVVCNKRNGITASRIAAEGQGFAPNWGSRMVQRWVQGWVEDRSLPTSAQGRHTKSFSLLDDPAVHAELQSYVRSNKWAMDPSKLAEFSEKQMVPKATKKYLHMMR